ncbi:MAG TPA: DUF4870 domain-containing protein [Spirillospora sp.]
MTDQPPPPDQPPPYAGPYGQDPKQDPHAQPLPGGPSWQPLYDEPVQGQAPYDQSFHGQAPHDQPPGQPPYPGTFGVPYDPRYGYGPPPRPTPDEDSTWAVLAYVLNLVVGLLPPLIIYLVKKNTSPLTRFHAAQSLNFQLTLLIHLLVVVVLCVPPAVAFEEPLFLIPIAAPYLELIFASWVFIILGAVKAGKRQYYRFPTFFCFRMVR